MSFDANLDLTASVLSGRKNVPTSIIRICNMPAKTWRETLYLSYCCCCTYVGKTGFLGIFEELYFEKKKGLTTDADIKSTNFIRGLHRPFHRSHATLSFGNWKANKWNFEKPSYICRYTGMYIYTYILRVSYLHRSVDHLVVGLLVCYRRAAFVGALSVVLSATRRSVGRSVDRSAVGSPLSRYFSRRPWGCRRSCRAVGRTVICNLADRYC